jgi:hypothetical protein
MIDTNAAVRTLLLQSVPLTPLVGTRIYCPSLPAGYEPAAPALSYSCRGGQTEDYVPILRPSYQFSAWGKTLPAAREVFRALHDHLLGEENLDLGSGVYFIGAHEEVHGQDRLDPDTGWFFVLAFYELIFRK